MKLLFVSPFPYWPNAGHGGATAAWAQLDALRHRHDICLLSFESTGSHAFGDNRRAAEILNQKGIRYTAVPLHVSSMDFRVTRLKSWFNQQPIYAQLNKSSLMSAAIKKAISEHKPDAVILQFPQMAQYSDACTPVPAFMDVQDAFSVSAFRGINAETSLRSKSKAFINWLRWVRYERQHYPKFAGVFTLTEQDLYGLKAYAPEIAGVSMGVPIAIPDHTRINRLGSVIRFVGNFGHQPNVIALRFFLTQVWPLVSHHHPATIFEVAGKNPPTELQNIGGPNVRFIGFVDDLSAFLAEASTVVIPLLSGGGVKIKTLEALSAGAPVVSTSIGVEGIGAQDGIHYIVRDNASEMAMALIAIITDANLQEKFSQQAAHFMREHFSPEAWADRFEDFVVNRIARNKNTSQS